MQVENKLFFVTKCCMATILMVLLQIGAFASSKEQLLWNKANDFYAQKHYDSAAAYYQKILSIQPNNAQIHYNLGNTFFRLNDIGLSVLHFEKAAFFDPSNKSISDNLKLAKSRIQSPLQEIEPVFFERWWQSLTSSVNSNVWALLSFVVFVGILFFTFQIIAKKRKVAFPGRWLSASVTVFILFIALSFFSYKAQNYSEKAVVVHKNADLKRLPEASAKIVSSIPEGTVLILGKLNAGYVYVQLPNGVEGWVLMQDIIKV